MSKHCIFAKSEGTTEEAQALTVKRNSSLAISKHCTFAKSEETTEEAQALTVVRHQLSQEVIYREALGDGLLILYL